MTSVQKRYGFFVQLPRAVSVLEHEMNSKNNIQQTSLLKPLNTAPSLIPPGFGLFVFGVPHREDTITETPINSCFYLTI